MNVSYTVSFRGIDEKQRVALNKMLRADIAFYPQRMSMESATVEEVKKAKSVPKVAVKKSDKKVKAHGKS